MARPAVHVELITAHLLTFSLCEHVAMRAANVTVSSRS